MVRVVVVGGGVAGLATAYFLRANAPPDLHLSLRVLESDAVPGGRVRSERSGGCVFEWGPHGFLDNAPDTMRLVRELGLEERMLRSRDAARRRFVLHDGRLKRVPEGPGALFASDLLTFGAKARLLLEPFVRRGRGFDESVAAFARRRLGGGVVAPLLEPFVTGVVAADAERLSVRSAFPRLWELERRHGSLARGLLARALARKRGGTPGADAADATPSGRAVLHSFRDGMGELPAALARSLGDAFVPGVRIEALQRDGAGFALELLGAAVPTMRADVLVIATPSFRAADLVRRLDPDLAANLDTIPSAGVAVACLVYPEARVYRPLDGFGFLCARDGAPGILGAIVASSVFDGHAPAGTCSLRVLMGGAHDPGAVELAPDALVERARAALAPLLGLDGAPIETRTYVHRRGIPQYTLGHHGRLLAVDTKLRSWPSLFVTGQSYRGVSVNDVIRNARKTAEHVVHHLLEEPHRDDGMFAGPSG